MKEKAFQARCQEVEVGVDKSMEVKIETRIRAEGF